MLILLIFGIIALAIGIPLTISDNDFGWILFPAFIAIIVGLFINFIIGLSLHGDPYEITTVKPLASINLSAGTSGQFHSLFFVASGYVNQKLTYLYYAKQPNGYYELQTRKSHNTFIQQSPNVTPNVKCITDTNHDPSVWWTVFGNLSVEPTTKCYITVPPGTIKNEYNLQLPSKG